MLKFCEKFSVILRNIVWWNLETVGEILKKNWWNFWNKISEIWHENFGEILRKMWWNFEKSLVKSWEETFGEILKKKIREIIEKIWGN